MWKLNSSSFTTPRHDQSIQGVDATVFVVPRSWAREHAARTRGPPQRPEGPGMMELLPKLDFFSGLGCCQVQQSDEPRRGDGAAKTGSRAAAAARENIMRRA